MARSEKSQTATARKKELFALERRFTAAIADAQSETSVEPGPGFKLVGNEIRYDITSLPKG